MEIPQVSAETVLTAMKLEIPGLVPQFGDSQIIVVHYSIFVFIW
jgi:hypothetical protein